MKGERIKTPEELVQAAKDKRAVIMCYGSQHRQPAAWVICMQFSLVMRLLETGIYYYVPLPK